MIRCFIAIELDPAVREAIGRLQARLRKELRGSDSGLRWVRAENIHLTLKFLGEIPDDAVPAVGAAADQTAAAFNPFEFEIAEVGSFPPERPARVVWVGVGHGRSALLELQKALDQALEEIGYPREERPFSAHLTLARVSQPNAGRAVLNVLGNLPQGWAASLGRQNATALTVFKSDLTRSGPTYTLLHQAALVGV